MKLKWSTAWQIVVWLLTLIAGGLDQAPAELRPYVVVIGAVISIVLHQVAGVHNPDGTLAEGKK